MAGLGEPPAGGLGLGAALGDGIVLQRIDDDEAEAVMDAAEPAGENYDATRQWSQFYALVREVDEAEYEETGDNYDVGGLMNETIALSRLIVDNAYCSEYAARLIDHNGRRQIAPILSFEQRLSYRLREGRFWVTEAEAGELAALRTSYRAVKGTLSGRVSRAMWRAERSTHTRFLDEAVMHVVTGLEALLKTERHQATNQFTTRALPRGRAWAQPRRRLDRDLRRALPKRHTGVRSHSSPLPGGRPADRRYPAAISQVARAQDLLRAAVRRAIEDGAFCEKFATDDAVRIAWPL